jgi:hypothetical protein
MGAGPFYDMQNSQAAGDEPVTYDGQPTGWSPPLLPFMSPAQTSGVEGTGTPAEAAAPGVPDYATIQAMLQQSQEMPDILERFETYKQAMLKAYEPSMRPKYTTPPKPTVAQWIMSMGTAGLDAADYAAKYNADVDKQNAGVLHNAMTDARALMQADSTAKMGQANLEARLMQLQLQILGQQSRQGSRDMTNLLTELRLRAFGTIDHPPTEAEQAAAGDQGQMYQPDPKLRGHFQLVPFGGGPTSGGPPSATPGATSPPPAAGSPLGAVLDPRRNAVTQSAPSPQETQRPTSPLTSEGLAMKKIERDALAKEERTKANAKTQAKVLIPQVDAVLRDPSTFSLLVDDANWGKTGVPGIANRAANYARSTFNVNIDVANRAAAGDPRVQKLRGLATMTTQLVKLGGDVGAITEPDKAPWEQFVKDVAEAKVTRQEAVARIRELRSLIQVRLDALSGTASPTGTTSTETAAPSRRRMSAAEFMAH